MSCSPHELLVHGYFRRREIARLLKKPLPLSLLILILGFYPKTSSYPGIFEDENHGSSIKVLDGYRISMKGYVSSIRLSYAIPINELIDYYWFFKIESGSKRNGYHFMGVCTNNTTNFKKNPYSGLEDCFGISGNPANIFMGGRMHRVKDFGKVIIDRVIKIEYYSKEKQLKFKWADNQFVDENEALFYTVQLPNSTVRNDITHYYPCMGIANQNNSGYLYKKRPLTTDNNVQK